MIIVKKKIFYGKCATVEWYTKRQFFVYVFLCTKLLQKAKLSKELYLDNNTI